MSAARDLSEVFAKPSVQVERLRNDALILRSSYQLQSSPRCVGEYLEQWAGRVPERWFLLERAASGEWSGVTYAEALDRVSRIATWLLGQRLSVDRPVLILSENGVEHGLLMLSCMHVGIPVASISPAYSTLSRDFAKLRAIFAAVRPGLVYAGDSTRFGRALGAVRDLHDAMIVVGSESEAFPGSVPFASLSTTRDDAAVARAFASVTADTIAKVMFTSGSTGEPKGVINTQRMLCSNQEAIAQVWRFLPQSPPVILDWLPWHHTFGGNHNFNLVLRNGGTLYVDGGRPVPGEFERTLTNLREIAPTLSFNVPRAYDLLVGALRSDDALRAKFFSRLELVFYAAAALSQPTWEALSALGSQESGGPPPMVSSWGLTESAPAATYCQDQADRSGVIGVPLPGCELKLVPTGKSYEARVRGPNVTPGYWKRSDLTAAAFDEDGFLRTGDAVRFVDPAVPERGLLFDGRLAEDFKLSTGTWVHVGALRLAAIAALAPIAQDVVLAGHDRDEIGVLVFPNVEACRRLCPHLPSNAVIERLVTEAVVRARVAEGLAALRASGGGSSTYATRALLLAEPPSLDAGEITDKGYLNQRAVLARRSLLIAELYRSPCGPQVITASESQPAHRVARESV
jgi:feruloyl-CoA synthase